MRMMSYQRVKINQTQRYRDEGITGKISGINDAIFLRNTYQTELDNANAAIVNIVHKLEEDSMRLKEFYSVTPAIKKNIEAHEQERHALYSSLWNLLKNETDFEKEMWKTTQEGQRFDTINIKQKFKDSDVDEMRYNSMMQYLKKYPVYTSKSSFSGIYSKIKEKEREILNQNEKLNSAKSNFNYNLSLFQKNIQKAEDKITAYENILQEGTLKLSLCRYYNSIFYRYASEETKAKVTLTTLKHRVSQFKNTLILIKTELSQYENKKFIEMEF